MKILGVNGIRSDGANNVQRMLDDLARLGWPVQHVSYPRVRAVMARYRSRQRRHARRILDAHEPGDCVIAHSYGCLLSLRAMELGAQFGTVFFFGAAMNEDFTFPYLGCRALHNIHDPSDRALGLGSLLVWHDFGRMGQTGYAGPPDPRVRNVPGTGEIESDLWRHSHYFKAGNRRAWVRYVHRELLLHHGQDVSCVI